jgi:hypothetical protein
MVMESDGGVIGIVIGLVWLAVMVIMIVAMWKVYTKAGEPGWAALIPIYNIVVLLKIVGKPLWWIVGLIIPLVNFVVIILVMIALAKAFGKGVGFAIGLVLLSPVFFPILAFSDAKYTAPPPAA